MQRALSHRCPSSLSRLRAPRLAVRVLGGTTRLFHHASGGPTSRFWKGCAPSGGSLRSHLLPPLVSVGCLRSWVRGLFLYLQRRKCSIFKAPPLTPVSMTTRSRPLPPPSFPYRTVVVASDPPRHLRRVSRLETLTQSESQRPLRHRARGLFRGVWGLDPVPLSHPQREAHPVLQASGQPLPLPSLISVNNFIINEGKNDITFKILNMKCYFF